MKKAIVIFLVTLCLFLCSGCQLTDKGVQDVPPAPEVLISVGELSPGKTFGDVSVEVTINGEIVEHTTEWTLFSEDGMGLIAETDIIPEDFWGRLDVFYYLPEGTDTTEIPINVNAPGGKYDGTGDVGDGPNGELKAWSHILYGETEEIVPNVEISVGELAFGQTFERVPILVTVDGNAVDLKIVWIQYSEDSYSELSMDDTIPENFWGRLDLYYFLPVGADPGNINVTIDAPGGTYDGTGEGATADDGALQAWSHIEYDFKQNEEPQQETPKQETHTHNWKKDSSKSQKVKCIVDGWNFYYCTDCKETKKEIIPSQGHSWDVNNGTITQEATCTAEGVKVIHCRNCEESYRDTLPAKGHSWGSPVISNSASCTASGTKTYTCIVCGAKETENIPGTGHSWSSFWYDNDSTHSRTCSSCGAVDRRPHDFDSNYYCPTCTYMIVN